MLISDKFDFEIEWLLVNLSQTSKEKFKSILVIKIHDNYTSLSITFVIKSIINYIKDNFVTESQYLQNLPHRRIIHHMNFPSSV